MNKMAIMRIKNDNNEWEEIDALIGPPGPSNNLSIGSVSKGEHASASITGDSPNQVLNLVLPKGDPGPQGETGPKPIKGEDYFTSEDIEELNISGIEKYVLLSDMSSSTPEVTALNSKYYNTSNKLIYTAIDEEHWSGFSEEPKRNVFYINTKNGSMYYWNGSEMVLVMPIDSVYLGTCTDEELEDITDTDECLKDNEGSVINSKIPRYEQGLFYKTSETKTGEKWIDGKPIYRIVIQSTVGQIQNVVNSLNIDTLVSHYGYAASQFDNYWPIPNTTTSEAGYNIMFYINISTKEFAFSFGNFFPSENTVQMILKYTKTTDTSLS